MQAHLTTRQITRARKLRSEGMGYAEIKTKLKTEAAADTIRSHCLDIAAGGVVRTRQAKGPMTRNGAIVQPFSAEDDAAIRAWQEQPEAERTNLNQLAKSIGRRRHSVLNRIKTLAKLDQQKESTNAPA